jgi:hypothetical protein
MPEAGPYGGKERHYVQEDYQSPRKPGGEHDSRPEAKLRRLLAETQEDLEERVRRAVKQWNLAVRDLIRNETALRLTVGNQKQTVPVKVQDGLPLPIARLVEEFDPILWWLTLHRPLLIKTVEGLRLTSEQREQLREWPPLKKDLPLLESFPDALRLMGRLVETLEEQSLIQRLRAIDEDVLGAYFFKIPEIRLYWMVIGLVSSLLGVSVEALTVAVLAHELVHAYTHLGLDTDEQHWDTLAFDQSDLYIVEGLAQFYTGVVCQRLEERQPEAYSAYKLLMDIQSEPYTHHQHWCGDKERAGEVVRQAMIMCRTNELKKYAEFLESIQRAQGTLGPIRYKQKRFWR